ncbi:MAG: periplasmic binding protein [Paenibacillus sp.]|nr:periplasmic binding protein [Paenibacillus sp.]
MSSIFKSVSLVLTLALVFVTGCANKTDDTKQSGASATPSSSPSASASPTPAASKSIKHAGGTTELKTTPKKVVALEWVYAEDVLALGVQPVGVADITGYKSWVNIKTVLGADVVDVGTRQEPSLEKIASLKPDLIIGVSFRHKAIYDKLTAIAPTVLFEPYPAEGQGSQYQEMEETLKTIANALDKKSEGETVLKNMNAAFTKAADKLKAAKKDGSEFALAQAFTSKDIPAIRIFTNQSMAAEILQKIGLKNAFQSTKFEVYGYSESTVEALPAIQKANFLYVVNDKDNIFTNQLKDNPVWKGLAFVKENRTYSLGGGTWLFGGPLSAEVFATQTADLLTK